MTVEQKLRMALAYKDMSQSELARKMGISPQSLNRKLNSGSLRLKDITAMADAIGCKPKITFDFGKEQI